ncbi:MAG: hypothetical protein KDC54_09615 [Lewinella sp.]|nr:hypothetical protein [Lewinella sp.]
MYLSERQLPFTTEKAYQGFAAVEGILKVEQERLVLEYQVKDNFIGLLKSGTKNLVIPYHQLSKVIYSRGLFRSQLQLLINSMHILGEFPASKNGLIILKIKRSFKEIAEDMEAYINLRIAEERLARAERDAEEGR